MHGFLVYTYCNMCYGAVCLRETYIYILNQTHVWDNRTDKEALETFKCQSHELYLYLQPQKLCLMCVLCCCHNICYSAMCPSRSLFHALPTTIAWHAYVGLAEAYLRKALVAQRQTYLYDLERLLDRLPPLAALSSSEACSGSRSPCVAEEELGSSLVAPTSRSQICRKQQKLGYYPCFLDTVTTYTQSYLQTNQQLRTNIYNISFTAIKTCFQL